MQFEEKICYTENNYNIITFLSVKYEIV